MLEHGGRLRRAAHHYRIPLADWLDLSTGINPCAYPLPSIPEAAWQRLPEEDDGLERAAAAYYGSAELLPVAGSQAAIQALPALIPGARVSLLAPSYAEHAHAWRLRQPRLYAAHTLEAAIDSSDVVVLVHPNNPTGVRFERDQLLDWHARLAQRGGWLIIDEAFIDSDPPAGSASLAAVAGRPGLVVLRSLGKFFGLAGARVGFVLAPAPLRLQLADLLGPWTVSGPARHVAQTALADRAWQQAARQRLAADSQRLAQVLQAAGLGTPSGPALFQSLDHAQAEALHDALARHGILTRLFAADAHGPARLRFGLPPDENGWLRLQRALDSLPEALLSNPISAPLLP
jgi:cobalamin biosynthetic protein CobC